MWDLSQTGDRTSVPWIERQILSHWTAREALSVMICTGNTGSSLHTFFFFFFLNLICQALCFSLAFKQMITDEQYLGFLSLRVSLPNEGQEWVSEWSVKTSNVISVSWLDLLDCQRGGGYMWNWKDTNSVGLCKLFHSDFFEKHNNYSVPWKAHSSTARQNNCSKVLRVQNLLRVKNVSDLSKREETLCFVINTFLKSNILRNIRFMILRLCFMEIWWR